jgi:type I restriction enzyme M protein
LTHERNQLKVSTNPIELYSEQDVISKMVIPGLTALGYDESKKGSEVVVRFNHTIMAQQGRQKKPIFADVVVFIGEVPAIVVDGKNPREFLTETDRDQVISYARLLENIAPYAALCNGSWQVFDAVTKQQIKALPRLKDLLSDLQSRRLSRNQRNNLKAQANRTLFAIDSVRDLSRLMRRCHDIIRNLKGYDPTKAFDELSKILFAKMFEEREIEEGRRQDNRFTAASVQQMRKQGVEIIQTLWHDTVTSDRYREVFSDEDPEVEIELPPEAIDRIVELLEDRSLGLTDLDVKGVAFEEFLSATYRGGGLGQYFTPREVVNFMVDLVEPAIGERTIDPSSGSGGFLIRVYDVVSEKIRGSDLSTRERTQRLAQLANTDLVGIDWEQRAARTCKMNMILHGDGHASVYQANALDLDEIAVKVAERRRFYPNAPAVEEGDFDVVLTNPPFGAKDDTKRILAYYELGKKRSQKREVLLLERHIRLLAPGGRLAVVIPEGILSNQNDLVIRQFILNECIVKAVIRLPQDAFKMSEGAACTSILYAVKKDPENHKLSKQGSIFFARAEFIGISPAGRPISQNDLLTIRENFRRFEAGEWNGIEMEPAQQGDRMAFRRAEPAAEALWLEPTVNRTSLLYDRLTYVIRKPKLTDRFSYTFNHPSYYRIMDALDRMAASSVTLSSLCAEPYPIRGKKPSEESTEGLSILKVRNITGQGIDLETEYAPDNETTRSECARSMVQKNDILITSTGEGTIGRVDVYPYDEVAIADNHVAICRLKADIDHQYVVEFLRSEYGQIQMLRYVSGSTGQTELLIQHVKNLQVPIPARRIQAEIVKVMAEARNTVSDLSDKAEELRGESAEVLARARRDMMKRLAEKSAPGQHDRNARMKIHASPDEALGALVKKPKHKRRPAG